MSQFDNTPIMSEPAGAPNPTSGVPGPAGWVQTWIKAISQPNEQTFIDISESPYAQSKTAYLWIFIATTLVYIVSAIAQVIATALSGNSGNAGLGVIAVTVCIAPVIGGISVLFFALGTAIIQWIAKLFGGVGTYDKLVYPIAAIAVPVSLIAMILTPFSLIPFVGLCTGAISIGVSFYSLFLQITAVKAVNRFGWGQAAGSVLIPGLAVLFVCGCIVAIGAAVMGTAIVGLIHQLSPSFPTP